MTIMGTRPEMIRLCLVIKKLDQLCDQVLVHTGQNYDPKLHDIFIRELGIRKIDYSLGAQGAFGEQVGIIFTEIEKIILKEKPDRCLILGDTNSALSAIVAKRLGVPVYHMEAGNRCFDDRVPEEVNRRLVDHSSTVLMPYSENSRINLLDEGFSPDHILVTGNPIKEVLDHYSPQIDSSDALEQFSVKPNDYFLATLHRSENVDVDSRLADFVKTFNQLHSEYGKPIIWSVHPHTRKKLANLKVKVGDGIIISEPLGLFDFVRLEKNALCVLSDSGTVQEECCIFKVPSVSLRDVTERPETLEAGSNILSGADPQSIATCVKTVLSGKPAWTVPAEYLITNVSDTVVRIMLSFSLLSK